MYSNGSYSITLHRLLILECVQLEPYQNSRIRVMYNYDQFQSVGVLRAHILSKLTVELETRLHQCLGSEKAHGMNVDNENDGIGRKCTHASHHHATEEYGRALGTPTPQEAVHHSGIGGGPPSSCLVNVAVRLQPALNDIEGYCQCPRSCAGSSAGDKVDYEWRISVKG